MIGSRCIRLLLCWLSLSLPLLAAAQEPYGAEIMLWRQRQASQKFDVANPGAFSLLGSDVTMTIEPAKAVLTLSAAITVRANKSITEHTFTYAGPPVSKIEDSRGLPLTFVQFSEGYLQVTWQSAIPANTELTLTFHAGGTQSCASTVALVDVVCEISSDLAWFLGAPYLPVPSSPDRYGLQRFTITVPRGFVAVASGRLTGSEHGATTSTYRFESLDETTSHGLAVGKFVRLSGTANGIVINVSLLARHQALLPAVLMQLQAMVPHYESWLGPLFVETLNVAPFGDGFHGAFAPQAAIFVSTFLLDRWDDARMAQLLAHELAHQWFGHQVSIASVRDVWLQEGMAEFLASHYAERVLGVSGVFVENALIYLGRVSAESDTPLAPLQSIDDATYFPIVYAKGSVILENLRHRMQTERFFAGLRALLDQYRFAFFDTQDFQRVMTGANGADLGAFFAQHVQRKGVPTLGMKAVVAGELDQGRRVSLLFTQSPKEVYPFELELTLHTPQPLVQTLMLSTATELKELMTPFPLTGIVAPFATPLLVRWRADGNADINRDGIVDGRDLLDLARAFGQTPLVRDQQLERTVANRSWRPLRDTDDNGVIDAADRDRLLEQFGIRVQ